MKTFLTELWENRTNQSLGADLPGGLGDLIYHVGVLELLDYRDIIKLDVEILVDALEGAPQLDVVLELDGDLVVDEGLEEAGTGSAKREHAKNLTYF